jgi:SAM-dependent methyltransferase
MSLDRLPLCAKNINKKYSDYSLLDLGCRTMSLKPMLEDCTEYYGTDLIPCDGVLQCDLEKPLPFENDSFDIVTVLDVLEHLDNPHLALKESLRIARKAVYVSLPNMYYIEFRLRFMMGNGISGKYKFSPEPLLDRHRWILSYSEAIEFINKNVTANSIKMDPIVPSYGRYKWFADPIHQLLASKWPNLFVYGAFFEIGLE